MISRNIMLDPTLPVESKAIYSILASLCSNRDSCFPTVQTLLDVTGISKDRLYKYLNILTERKIVERVHDRSGGRYKNVVYRLHDEEYKKPFPENTEKENTVSGFYLQPFPDFKDSPFPENKESKNSNIKNSNIKNNINSAPLVQNEETVREEDEWEDPEESLRKWEEWKAQQEKQKKDKTKQEANDLFEKVWKLYPNKKGKGQVSDTQKKKLLKIGEEELTRAIERYKADLSRDEWRKPQNGSTFFNSGYVDYLDENWQPGADSSDPDDDAAAWEKFRSELNEQYSCLRNVELDPELFPNG